jgi:hypothetical protein
MPESSACTKVKKKKCNQECRIYFIHVSHLFRLTSKFSQEERGDLALLLLPVRWVMYRAKANVPNAVSRFIEN